MQNLYTEVASLDKRCYEEFALSEDLLMEHAAEGMATYIRRNFQTSSSVQIVCGSGNNGADGLACARLLHGEFDIKVILAKEPKSPMALLQQKRVYSLGIEFTAELGKSDVLIDAIVGTGFNGEFDETLQKLLQQMNSFEGCKIACDVPSGLKRNGEVAGECFQADVTLTMGALKRSMFLDEAKDFVGEIEVLNLGICREFYEVPSNWQLLDMDDLMLPFRVQKDSHKGSYGHLGVIYGEKWGAASMCAGAALRFGTGLVTLVGFEEFHMPQMLMSSHELPANTSALVMGMGLGNTFSDEELEHFLDNDLPLVADADIFHMPILSQILKRKNVVLTPHAKEFVSLLRQTGIADISVSEAQKNRFEYVEKFSKQFPNVTLLLKGANVIIASEGICYINPHGTAALAKGGSGDVLAGLIASLLAQGNTPQFAAINGSLTHAKLAFSYDGADFSLTPEDLIQGLRKLS